MKCPCCERGTIEPSGVSARACNRCGVVILSGSLETSERLSRTRAPKYPQDQGQLGAMADYAATKADKEA